MNNNKKPSLSAQEGYACRMRIGLYVISKLTGGYLSNIFWSFKKLSTSDALAVSNRILNKMHSFVKNHRRNSSVLQ